MGDDKTNPRTPSAMHALGLAVCPRCDGTGKFTLSTIGAESLSIVDCDFCEGSGRVTLKRHHEYVGLKPSK